MVASRTLSIDFSTFPDSDGEPVVFEITSKSTVWEDLGHKVRLYGQLGAREYYIYDPAQELQPPLQAYHRVGSRLVDVPLQSGLAIYSEALEAELRVVGEWLRLIDPATGEPYPTPEEEHLGRLTVELQAAKAAAVAEQEAQARQQEAQARQAAEARAHREAEARQTAEAQAQREAQARRAAEEALQAALAELAHLRGLE